MWKSAANRHRPERQPRRAGGSFTMWLSMFVSTIFPTKPIVSLLTITVRC
jgi:hypothetical protein